MTRYVLAFIFYCIACIAHSEPWFTGPLIALSGETLDPGKASLQLYAYDTNSTSTFNNDWNLSPTDRVTAEQFSPQFTYGLAKGVDVEVFGLYERNMYKKMSYSRIGDTSLLLGFQIFKQNQEQKSSLPSLRFTIQEVIPTGSYDLLMPANLGTDATGTGGYQTNLGLNFQYLSKLNASHYLNLHFCLNYILASSLDIDGLSIYGGSELTKGRIAPGNAISLDLATELSITQNWVAVLEGYFIYQQPSVFNGLVALDSRELAAASEAERLKIRINRLRPSKLNLGRKDIGHGSVDMLTLAPAIEYNISSNLGVIAGTWFTTSGKNTLNFLSSVVTLSLTWG